MIQSKENYTKVVPLHLNTSNLIKAFNIEDTT